MIVLDTNVISALMRMSPEEKVIAWLDRQPRTSIWITSVTVLEVRFGLQIMAAGKRRVVLMQAFDRLVEKLDQRVLPFDIAAAEQAATLMAVRNKRGQPVELRDTLIAGIVLAQRASLATRNRTHFADAAVPLINPWLE